MEPNKIVARFQDGRMLKGYTNDFFPNKELFHLTVVDSPQEGGKPVEVKISSLKAVFFVKDFAGNKDYKDKKEFDSSRPVLGRKIQVVFLDGEVFVGTTQGYQPGRQGFFVIPADPNSNVERSYIVTAATKQISFL